ncbi:hypothetical protein DNJ95_11410 [Stutzerimonas kirkiae]|uniref:Uncharacterized protein n=1 Tax=Stutzerimonas kirkiae TaxID=2211392 RepID=A0A4Q9R2S8_9GAMM|nr:tetratricopeptide repeat protein [Stutzerimonas kirkiae]TBU93526.1 hypothetical protein DNJ96_13890 [Stutzerimonas kirkiae]TBV01732.1 hypothetical protein DNJ95_11410 [Stutzerimonas kirkiae]TBV11063.1 hypothetical protein DNK01_16910 [Stutzerimonas kirkiae]
MTERYRILALLLLVLQLAGCAGLRSPALHTDGSLEQAAQRLEAGELRIAGSALQSGDLDLALSLYERLARKNPEVASVWLGLADTRFLMGTLAAANDAYATAQRLAPENPASQLGQARILLRQRRLPEAIARFEAILARFADHPQALAGLGVAHDLGGDPRQAQRIYRQGLARYPDDAALRNNLGLSLALDGKPREAVNILLGTQGLSGQLPQERDNLALAYGLLGRDEAAEEVLAGNQSRDRVQDNLAFYRYLRQLSEVPDATAIAQ